MGHVAQAEGDGDAVEMVVREGQLFRIRLNEAHIAGHALVQQAVTADLEHGGVDIRQYHLTGGADQTGELARQIAGATGNVQHPVTRPHPGQLDGEALPQAVNATGHEVVHQVVLGRNRVEYLGHLAGFLRLVHGLKAEMGGAV